MPATEPRTWRGEPGGWLEGLDFLTYGAAAAGLGLAALIVALLVLDSLALAIVGGAILLAVAGAYLANDFFNDW
ncbi:MAG TPA: hypothetical protein VF752_07290 [Thermoleophilaceae bacterium]